MKLLLISLLILLIILIVKYFFDKLNSCGFKLFVISGISFGLITIGLYYLFSTTFAASTPVNIQTENKTNEELHIYSITFWDNDWIGKGNYVEYDTKLKPKEKSDDFWFENDGSNEFWIVAKNEENEIIYLNVFSDKLSRYNLKINKQKNIDPNKSQIAKKLTSKTDKKIRNEKYMIWANCILIGLLIISLIKNPRQTEI